MDGDSTETLLYARKCCVVCNIAFGPTTGTKKLNCSRCQEKSGIACYCSKLDAIMDAGHHISLAAGGCKESSNASVSLMKKVINTLPINSMNDDLKQELGELPAIFINARKNCNVCTPDEDCDSWSHQEGQQKAILINLATLAMNHVGASVWISSFAGVSRNVDRMFDKLCQDPKFFLFKIPIMTHISNLATKRPKWTTHEQQGISITNHVQKLNDTIVRGYRSQGYELSPDYIIKPLMNDNLIIYVADDYDETELKHKSALLQCEAHHGTQFLFEKEIEVVHIECGGVNKIGEPRWKQMKVGYHLRCSSCYKPSVPIHQYVPKADYNPLLTATYKEEHEMISITSTVCGFEKEYSKRYFEDPLHTTSIMCACKDKGEGKRTYNSNHAKNKFVLTSEYARWNEKNVVIQCKICRCELTQKTMPLDEWEARKDPYNRSKTGRMLCRKTSDGCGNSSSIAEKQWEIISGVQN